MFKGEKMKKILASLLLIFMLVTMSLAGCATDSDRASTPASNRFQTLNVYYAIGDFEFDVVVDTKTQILYLARSGALARNTDITVFYNADGTPYTYDEFMAEREDKQWNSHILFGSGLLY